MATSKRSAGPSRTGKPSSKSTHQSRAAAIVDGGGPAPAAPATGAISWPTLLMVGADRVIIDESEDDDLHFMAEYIDPA